eukprot:195514-Chlamydomonas_euryale.AAC.4
MHGCGCGQVWVWTAHRPRHAGKRGDDALRPQRQKEACSGGGASVCKRGCSTLSTPQSTKGVGTEVRECGGCGAACECVEMGVQR